MAISLQNSAVQSYILYSSILALKMLALATLTIIKRMTRKTFANPEDAINFNVKVNFNDEEVNRVRRAHLNDLENLPAFWILGALYLTTDPVAAWATLLFRVFTVGRILHTIVYVIVPVRQPARAISYAIPSFVMVYMGLQVIMYYSTAV